MYTQRHLVHTDISEKCGLKEESNFIEA